jgi:phosphatidylethanolamine-binding protein (PEBP) family uncharacterized protein
VGPIPAEYAFCAMDAKTHATLSANRNPQLAWIEVPMGTKSFAVICHDPDVPSAGDDVNKEGRTVPKSLARVDFFHWVLVDLPAAMVGVQAGEFSSSVVAHGKPGPAAPHGARHGVNDYTGWFAGDKDMGGDYYGYDGPCPAVERRDPAPLHLHGVRARRRAPSHRGPLRRARGAPRDQGPRARAGVAHRPLQPQSRRQGLRRLFLAALAALAWAPAWALEDAKLWEQLRRGGNVILLRHAEHAAGSGRPARIQARRLRHAAQSFRGGGATRRAESASGFAPSACRWRRSTPARGAGCRDTAMLAFGKSEDWAPLSSIFDVPDKDREYTERVKKRIGTYSSREMKGNVVMVTHNVNIASLTKLSVAPGEIGGGASGRMLRAARGGTPTPRRASVATSRSRGASSWSAGP